MTSVTDASTNITAEPCKKTCGFFGNAQFDGFCSRCYHEEQKTIDTQRLSSPVDDLSLTNQSNGPTTKRSRCPNCQKNLGIVKYSCACGEHFCGNCRYSSEHRCPIDYKDLGRKLLAKTNPQVIADRVHNRQ